MSDCFAVLQRSADCAARIGQLKTIHGEVRTPVFMPVGTQATVKALTPTQVGETGASILLGNTYHLNLRPGSDIVREMGGLHRFMGWDGPILTDSGGFQAFSLSKLRKISDRGVDFQSHIDGRRFLLSPEECMRIQDNLGTDIAMVLDECSPWPCSEDKAAVAVERTLKWAAACLQESEKLGWPAVGRLLFAIVQGSTYPHLREHCTRELAAMPFPGYAVGGVSVGEPEEELLGQAGRVLPLLPEDKPRYVMGVVTPPQLLELVRMGADMFDCVMPTRLARHGTAFTEHGTINLKNERFKRDERPLMDTLDNYTNRNFSRAYLRHLVVAGESLAGTLLSIHNLSFYANLMQQAGEHIAAGDYVEWAQDWTARFSSKMN